MHVKQKELASNQERYDAIVLDIDHLLATKFIREAMYPNWASNVVLAKRSNGKGHRYVNFMKG